MKDFHGLGVGKRLRSNMTLFKTKVSFAVGSGSKVKFYKDNWCSGRALTYMRLFLPCLPSLI